MAGQREPSSKVEPASVANEGHSASKMVSLSRSSAHMPRVILRTTEPAKLLACQSVESRCTRQKPSCAMSRMMLSVKRISPRNEIWRKAIMEAPRPIMAKSAASARSRAWLRSGPIRLTASISRPAYTGISTSASVAPPMPSAIPAVSQG